MGNIGSQIANNSNKYKLEPTSDVQQRLSLPRIGQNQQQKVLPVSKEPHPKLRSTENGKILHSGGTLSGRHQESRMTRGNFMNVKEKVNLLKELQENNNNKANLLRQNREEHLKKFGSEPDLRVRLRREKASNFIPKKYDDWMIRRREGQLNTSVKQNDNSSNTRRIGLFKTRMESNKKYNNRSPDASRRNNCIAEQKAGDMARLSLPELQKDASTTIQRLETDECAPNLTNRCAKEEIIKENCDLYINEDNNMKKYYFGMEDAARDCRLDYRIEDCTSNEILANLTADCVDTESGDHPEITLNLRPILPKKQLEIPRFSSSLAWKLLYSVDGDSNLDRSSANNTDDDPLPIEERIAPLSPSRLSKSLDFQFSQDKSGDSGISGDETPKPTMTWNQYYKSKQSWTPQQDLDEDDSSTDDEEIRRFNSVPYYNSNADTGANKPHIFSLSLPRDHFTNQCAPEKYKNHLKRSASGLLNNDIDLEVMENRYSIKNSNWLLSKSAPNSLNNGFASLDSGNCMQNGPSSFLMVHGKGRIMYLPQGNTNIESGIGRAKNEAECSSPENYLRDIDKRERQRLKEVEAMQRIEEEFRRKRARYNGLYTNNQQDFRKALFTTGEKSV